MKLFSTDYSHLPAEEDDLRNAHQPSRQQRCLRLIGLVSLVLLTTLLGVVAGSTRPLKIHWPTTPKITSCGHTSSEARERGCVLEPMVYGWMPPQCQYPEVTNHNKPFEKWQWYADENMTKPLSREQLDRGEFLDLWTNRAGYHTEHCLFLYRKLIYAMQNKVTWIDKKTLAVHHAYHCVDQLSASSEAWNATTWTGLAMYDCERAPWA